MYTLFFYLSTYNLFRGKRLFFNKMNDPKLTKKGSIRILYLFFNYFLNNQFVLNLYFKRIIEILLHKFQLFQKKYSDNINQSIAINFIKIKMENIETISYFKIYIGMYVITLIPLEINCDASEILECFFRKDTPTNTTTLTLNEFFNNVCPSKILSRSSSIVDQREQTP